MLKSCVSSYVFNVYPIRKENNRVTLENCFGESENLDIIDVIEERLKNGEAFKIENIRFGEGTAADNEATREAVSEENKGLTTETTKAKIRLKKIIRKGIARDDDATSLYKYLLFTVTYGENGDRGTPLHLLRSLILKFVKKQMNLQVGQKQRRVLFIIT